MKKKDSVDQQYPLPKWFKIAAITIVILTVTLPIAGLVYWRSTLTTYDQAVASCGGKRPILTSAYMGKTYTIPTDKTYDAPKKGSEIIKDYFCTVDDAEASGYRHSSLN